MSRNLYIAHPEIGRVPCCSKIGKAILAGDIDGARAMRAQGELIEARVAWLGLPRREQLQRLSDHMRTHGRTLVVTR